MAKKGKSEIAKLEKKLAEIKAGKWNESEERIQMFKDRLIELKR